MYLEFYSSAFCDPCIQTRVVLAEVARLLPTVAVTELDVVRDDLRAADADIRSTPTVIVRSGGGHEVFRAEGVPTINQVLVALAKLG